MCRCLVGRSRVRRWFFVVGLGADEDGVLSFDGAGGDGYGGDGSSVVIEG